MKIIVVDDEPLVKQYIVQCVRDAGGENEITAAVTSGAKVLQEMKANRSRECSNADLHS